MIDVKTLAGINEQVLCLGWDVGGWMGKRDSVAAGVLESADNSVGEFDRPRGVRGVRPPFCLLLTELRTACDWRRSSQGYDLPASDLDVASARNRSIATP